MTSPLVARDTLPEKDFSSVTQIGLKAVELAAAHQAEIEPRLPAGTLAGLAEDIESLGAVVPGARQARDEARCATVTQYAALEKGYARVRSIRTAVRKATPAAGVRRAYGVGQKMYAESVRDVRAALQQIIDRAKANVAEAKGFGLLPVDVVSLEGAVQTISDANSTQETRRAAAPLSTKTRNRTANRVLMAVKRIAGAGLIAFANQPVELASFEELMRGAESRRRGSSTGR